MTIIDEEKKYRQLKESIKMINSRRSDAEKINLIDESKKNGINEVINRNIIIDNSLKPWMWYLPIKMKSYSLKCRKDTENINPRVPKLSNNRTPILSKCAKCGRKKPRFVKN